MPRDDDERIALGKQAEQVWTNPLVQDFFQNEVQKIFAEWLNTGPDSKSRRDDLYFEALAINRFKNRFLRFISDGKAVQRNTNEKGVADGVGPII